MKEYTISFDKINFTKNNPSMKARKIDLKLSTLLVWLGRHVVRDHHSNSEWFGGKEEDSKFIFWFKTQEDRDKAESFLNEVLENGIPKMRV